MGIAMIYDIAALAVIAWFVAKGCRSGLVASVVRLLGKLVAFAGAFVLSRPIAQLLYNTFVRQRLVAYVDKVILENPAAAEMLDGLEGVLAFFTDKAEAFSPILQSLGRLPGASRDVQVVASYPGAESKLIAMMDSGASLSEAITEAALSPAILVIMQAVTFLVLFFVFSLLVGWVANLLGVVNRIPVIGTVNGFLGGALGAAEALLSIYILGVALSLLIAATGGNEYLSVEILESTHLVRRIIYYTLP